MYKYAPFAAEQVDVETALKAGRLVYYRDGAAATISVKRLTGTLSNGSPINCIASLPAGAVLNLIPEPSTCLLSLIAIAIGLPRASRRRATNTGVASRLL